MMAEGLDVAEVQKRGNTAYKSLDAREREAYQKKADDVNSNRSRKGNESVVSRTRLIRKIVSNIDANVGTQLLSLLR